MGRRFTRRELHDLVWSEPMTRVAERVGVSGVAMAKACRQALVPVPPRGHWARKAAGKRVVVASLPPRPPGMADETVIGGSRYGYHGWYPSREEILAPLPPEPTFDEAIEEVRGRVERMLGKVSVPKSLESPHPAVARLLRQDEERREKQKESPYVSTFYALLYDSPVERRRLRLVSAILVAAARCGGKASAWGSAPFGEPVTQFVVSVGRQAVRLRVAAAEVRRRSGKGADAKTTVERRMRVELCPADDGRPAARVWEDGEEAVERHVREIALAVVVKGEELHRAEALSTHAWRVRQQAEVLVEMRKEREEAERKERERLAELERRRVERLLGEAEALRKARGIRRYVEEVRAANATSAEPVPAAEMDAWSEWALAQADRIDPVGNGAFRRPYREERT